MSPVLKERNSLGQYLRGYNGKRGWHPTQESRLKMSLAHLGQSRPVSEATKRKIGDANRIALLGKVPWNKQIRVTLICLTCKKMVTTPLWNEKRRKYCSTECRIIAAPQKKIGKENNMWRGGITPENIKIRTSAPYKKWRMKVFQRDWFRCVFCGYKGRDIHADHIKPFSSFPDLRLNVDNGRTLCIPCHRKTSSFGRPKTINI